MPIDPEDDAAPLGKAISSHAGTLLSLEAMARAKAVCAGPVSGPRRVADPWEDNGANGVTTQGSWRAARALTALEPGEGCRLRCSRATPMLPGEAYKQPRLPHQGTPECSP